MKRDLLDVIKCPVCGLSEFDLHITKENNIEIRSGYIECYGCQQQFEITEGILNLLVNPTKEIIDEQKGWAELVNAVENTEELMLSLPDGIGEHKSAWASMAVNFHYMWSQLQLTGQERVLDLGSGRCWATRYFSHKGCQAVGLDIILTKYVGLLTSDIYINHENIYFDRILGDMNNTPFQGESFDIIFMAATMHHSSDLGATMKQVESLLKPGGKLVLINEPTVGLFHQKVVEGPEIEHGVNEHVYWFFDYIAAIRRAGMSYKLYPYMGSYHRLLARIHGFLRSRVLKPMAPDHIWLPIVYCQLIFSKGVLNIVAEKPIEHN